jgi:hypothetical protein
MPKLRWVLLLILLSPFIIALRPREDAFFVALDFEPAVWREHAHLHDEVLSDQARRLVRQRILIGKTRAEVIDLLGKPSFVLGRDDQEDPDGPRLIYRLGPYGFVGVDYEWLTVLVEADGRVSKCYCRRD